MILHCQKTGQHWPCNSQGHGDLMARRLGLKDYIITAAGDAPPSMRETVEAMLRGGAVPHG